MMPVDPEPTPSVLVPSATSSGSSRRRRDSVSSKRSSRSSVSTAATSTSGVAGLPSHVELNKDSGSYGEIQTAIKLFRATNDSAGGQGWTVANDPSGNKIVMKKRGEGEIPVVKGEADIGGGVTTEQVLGTILHSSARILCESITPTFACDRRLDTDSDPRLQGILVSKESIELNFTTVTIKVSLWNRKKESSRLSSESYYHLRIV